MKRGVEMAKEIRDDKEITVQHKIYHKAAQAIIGRYRFNLRGFEDPEVDELELYKPITREDINDVFCEFWRKKKPMAQPEIDWALISRVINARGYALVSPFGGDQSIEEYALVNIDAATKYGVYGAMGEDFEHNIQKPAYPASN